MMLHLFHFTIKIEKKELTKDELRKELHATHALHHLENMRDKCLHDANMYHLLMK